MTAALQALAYVSSARSLLSEPALAQLLERSRARNAAVGVSGLLLYCGGNFMQYLEGPDEPLQSIYADILADPRHHGVIEILREPVRQRAFAGWSMAYVRTHHHELLQLRDALAEPSAASATTDTAAGRLGFLREFWDLHHRRSQGH